jgi:hypothetical protein
MRMPVRETILIFKEFKIPLLNILDLYLGFIKINNSNFVYSYEQLEEIYYQTVRAVNIHN